MVKLVPSIFAIVPIPPGPPGPPPKAPPGALAPKGAPAPPGPLALLDVMLPDLDGFIITHLHSFADPRALT